MATKRPTAQPFAADPDNIEFFNLMAELAGRGVSQQEVATLVGVSPGQLSRVKKGERHAAWKHIRVLREHLRTLTADQATKVMLQSARPGIAWIDQTILRGLSVTVAVEAFRDLLWARAAEKGIPSTRVSISSEVYTADGGVDASVFDGAGPALADEELLSSGKHFQIKTGDFEPWKPAVIHRELFRRKAKKLENLGGAVQRILRDGHQYVLACFGVDLIGEQRHKARNNLAAAFKVCGFPNAQVDVWGQTELIGLFQQYPALCLRLRGLDQQGFRTRASWALDDDMQTPVHFSPEQLQLLDELRADLVSGRFPHVRLIGEPGVGKTRLAMEITGGESLAPATLYVGDPQALLRSSFLSELIHRDHKRFVVLVVDECAAEDRAELWNVLKPRADRVRLITIDHGPENAVDDKMRIVTVEPVGRLQIVSILTEYGIEKREAERWAHYCEGCPRVAHVLGDNLQANRDDLLQPPAKVNLWDRFIVGKHDRGSEEIRLRWIVLRYLALFERFGFAPPIENEARFIASIAEKCDARLTWPRFQEIVCNLRQRRIIQGSTTLYITPRLLHVHLYREFWQLHGGGFNLTGVLQGMPAQLRLWVITMLRYAEDSPNAAAAVNELLGPGGFLPHGHLPDTHATGRLLMALAESSPQPTLRYLRRAIGHATADQLIALREARQEVVWALERLAVRDDCFLGSAELLLRLTEAENSKNGNNASGTFVQLFSLLPGLAATQASAARRNGFLRETLNSDSLARRRIGLAAAQSALSTRGGTRMLGAEWQGLQRTFEFWRPKTWGEYWDAYREVWELVAEKLGVWKGEERSALIRAVIASAGSALHVGPLAPAVLQTLEALIDDAEADLDGLVAFCQHQLKYRKDDLTEETVKRLGALKAKLDGHDFSSRLRRYVKYATTDDQFDGDHNVSGRLDQELEALACEAVASPGLLAAELRWLLREDSNQAFCLAYRIASHDITRTWLPTLLEQQELQGEGSGLSIISGYLCSIYKAQPSEWEGIMLSLAEKPFFQTRYADLVISSGISNAVARKTGDLCRAGLLDLRRLSAWWFRGLLHHLDESVFQSLCDVQLVEKRSDLWSGAVQMFDTYYLGKESRHALPEEATYRLLTSPHMVGDWVGNSVGYYWSRLGVAFVTKYPARKWEFFREMMRLGVEDWKLLDGLECSPEAVLTGMLRSEPAKAWECIAEVLPGAERGWSFGIQHWLNGDAHRLVGNDAPGMIQFVPPEKLFAWVDKDVETHGEWLITALPKTLDKSTAGRLTREFIARYGKNEMLRGSLSSHFHSRGWCGNASDHYRRLREAAREWLADEKQPIVVRWIEDYIDWLSRDIQAAEIWEERERW